MNPRGARAKSVDADYGFLLEHSLELGRKYPGQWVAIEDGEVYHGRSLGELSRRIKKAGCADPLFVYMTPPGDLILGSAS